MWNSTLGDSRLIPWMAGFSQGVFLQSVGGVKKKKELLVTNIPKITLELWHKHNYYGSNRKKWHLPPHFKGSYLSVSLIGAKIWHFKIFLIFWPIFFPSELFWAHRSIRHSRNQCVPFKESVMCESSHLESESGSESRHLKSESRRSRIHIYFLESRSESRQLESESGFESNW